MFLLDRRSFLHMSAAAGLGAGAMTLLPGQAAAGVSAADVFTADAMGGNVDSTVIVGDEAVVLIDAQFTEGNATRLADLIAAIGKRLETVFITHAHPDHYSGLPLFRARFPELRAVTHPLILPLLPGEIGPVEALGETHLLLDGERLEVLEPMHGDTDLISAVHIPALDTLIASDIAYTDTHVWVRENLTVERMDLWRASLDRLEAIGARIVVPGHRAETSANDASVFTYTRAYLDLWQRALVETDSADALRARLMGGRETLGLGFAVDMAVAAVYPE